MKQFQSKKRRVLTVLLSVSLIVGSVVGVSAAIGWKNAIPAQKTYNFETPAMAGTDSMLLQENPDRGLRMEVYMDVATRKSLFEHAEEDAFAQLEDEIALYASDRPQLAQVYFYLTGYKDNDLDETAFQNMNDYFDRLKEHNIKAVLRFAYISDDTKPLEQEPADSQVERHLKQLKDFLMERQDQINVFQAGLIGAWGEWDSNARSRVDEKRILQAVLDNTPQDMYIQVRYLNIKNQNVDPEDTVSWNRVGYHDDFLIGNLHGWNTAGSDPSSDAWKQMTKESANLLVDGEMIWGSANSMYTGGKSIDSILMAQRLKEHHFTSLSMTHNYKERGGSFSMVDWQSEYINQNILDKNGLPYEKSWFLDADGNNLPRTMFAYIRDYLGYYLKVEGASASVNGKQVTVNLQMQNYGFAAPLMMNAFEVVLLDADGQVAASAPAGDPDALQPQVLQNLTIEMQRPDAGRAYTVALSLRADGGETIRLANELSFQNGYTILGVLK